MRTSFTTPKGTLLPLLNLRGKEYLQVMHRLVWMREEHPAWGLTTEIVHHDEKRSVVRASILESYGGGNGFVLAQATKQETGAHFPDHLEKAETGAVGRALAMCGYGTQFCADELNEGERIVDSPAEKPKAAAPAAKTLKAVVNENGPIQRVDVELGSFRINFGKKYLGKLVKDIPHKDLLGYIDWLEQKAKEKNQTLDTQVVFLKDAVARFYGPSEPDILAEDVGF